MKLKSILATAALALLTSQGAQGAVSSLQIFTGSSASISSSSSFVKSNTVMEQTSAGVFTGIVTLNYETGYYFTFGEEGENTQTTYFSAPRVTGGTSLDIPVGESSTVDLVASYGNAGYCWFWADSKDSDKITQNIGEVELEATVDTNAMTVSLKNISKATVTDPVPNSLVLQIGRYRSISAMRSGNTVAPTIKGNILEYKFTLTPESGYYFCFYNNANYSDMGPGTTSEVAINLTEGQTVTSSVAYGENRNGNCWYWSPQTGEAVFKATLDWTTREVTFEYLGEPVILPDLYSVTIDFTAENFVMGTYLANYIDVTDILKEEQLDLTASPVTFSYREIPSVLNFAARDGYEFAIESSNPALEGEGGYTLSGISPMDMDDDLIDFGTQQVLGLYEKADGLTFTVTLKRVPQENLPNELYMMVGEYATTLNPQLKPSNNDQHLTFNPDTQCYEGTVTLPKRRFKFYIPTQTGYTVFGQNGTEGDGFISFGRDLLPYTSEGGWSASSCWYLTSTFNNVNEMNVRMVVDVINNAVTFYPVLPEAPAELYIWGSTTGGFNPPSFSYFATMKPSESNPNLFTAEIDVPFVGPGTYTDEENGFVYEFEGWAFKLCVNRNSNNSGNLAAQEGSNVIDFSKMVSFNSVLNGYTQLYSISSGRMTFMFDWETLQFVALNEETPESFDVTLDFVSDTIDIEDVNDYVGVFDLFAEDSQLDIFENPFTYSFSGAKAALVIGAYEDYEISVECTNYDGPETSAPFQITGVGAMAEDDVLEYGPQYTLSLYPGADGLNFRITIIERGTSKVDTLGAVESGEPVYFNLQGQRVANPERGIFIKVADGKASKIVL